MRSMQIRVNNAGNGTVRMRAAFRKNWPYYLQEALGLGIFMLSACYFGASLYSPQGWLYSSVSNGFPKDLLMGVVMGLTALFIFYCPFTAPSGSQINPAVTITFLRLNRMCRYDALFFILFQLAGACTAVWCMQLWMGSVLTDAPVRSVVTLPGSKGPFVAAVTELLISCCTMYMVLVTSGNTKWSRFTRPFAAVLIIGWVVFAGPLSGFGMNPARSFASAFMAGVWDYIGIYMLVPVAGMLIAAEIYLFRQNKKSKKDKTTVTYKRKFTEPLEFML